MFSNDERVDMMLICNMRLSWGISKPLQNFKIIHVFGSSYEWKTYYWVHLNFVRVRKLCESVCIFIKYLMLFLMVDAYSKNDQYMHVFRVFPNLC
jgi:hypothetical protein